MNKTDKAIVTLAIGDAYIKKFNKYCRSLWEEYANKYGHDLIVIGEPLDKSSKAKYRSPAWQKCLVLSNSKIKRYEQVAWIDSDILINPDSPNIFNNVPIRKVGAVDAYSTPSKQNYKMVLERVYGKWENSGVEFIKNSTPTEYHNKFGLEGNFESVVQTGVLIISPEHHKDLFEYVYNHYEDKGAAHWNYEMRPLSYEILNSNLGHWINYKFNMPWGLVKQFHYPFINNESKISLYLQKIGCDFNRSLKEKCATTAFLNNYFLHFAGCANEMKLVNPNVHSIFEI